MHNQQSKGNLYVFSAAILWSFGGAVIKLIPWNSVSLACVRGLIAAAVFMFYRKNIKVCLTKTTLLGGLSLFFTTLFFIFANKYTTSANAIVLQYTAPVYVILLNVFIHRAHPERIDLIAVTLTILGITVFFIDSMNAGSMLGNLMGLLSGVCFALVLFISSHKDSKPADIYYTGYLFNLLLIPFLAFDPTFSVTIQSALAVLFLGVVQMGIAYILFSRGIQKTTAVSASVITAIEPILNPIWALIIIGERPSFISVLAGLFVVLVITAYNFIKVKLATKQRALSDKTATHTHSDTNGGTL